MHMSKNDISALENSNSKFAVLFQCFLFVLVVSLIGILIFSLSRLLLLYSNGGFTIFDSSGDIIRAIQLGLMFDSKTIYTLLLLFYIISIFCLVLPKKFLVWYSKMPLKICSVLVLSFCIFFSIVNFYFLIPI